MKVLLAPSSFDRYGSGATELLSANGYDVVRNPHGRRLTAEEVVELAADCVGIVSGLEPLSEEVLRRLPALRCISRCGSGVDNVDLAAAEELGIVVTTTPDAPVRAVAELTLGLVLDLLRHISRHDRRVRRGEWRKEPGWLLEGRTVGVVGLGRIGRAFAELAGAIGARVVGTDLRPDPQWAARRGVALVSLDELLGASDIVTVHVSRRRGEPPILGAAELGRMRPSALLVNVARGEAVDEAALVARLRSGALAGAALDVFSEEPYRGPLVELDNVVLTPHIGSSTRETIDAMERQAVRNLLEVLERVGKGAER